MHIFLTEVIDLDIKESVISGFGVASESVLDTPKIMIIGKSEIYVENYLALCEYNSGCIRLITKLGMTEIQGEGFEISQMKENNIIIKGKILGVRLI